MQRGNLSIMTMSARGAWPIADQLACCYSPTRVADGCFDVPRGQLDLRRDRAKREIALVVDRSPGNFDFDLFVGVTPRNQLHQAREIADGRSAEANNDVVFEQAGFFGRAPLVNRRDHTRAVNTVAPDAKECPVAIIDRQA